MQSPELVHTIAAGAFLAGSTRAEGSSDLKSVLISRLAQYDQHLDRPPKDRSDKALEDLQLETACEALHVVSRAQSLLDVPVKSTESQIADAQLHDAYIIGTRDLEYMKTLLSVAVKWGFGPILQRVMSAIPSTVPPSARKQGMQIIDLTTVPEDYTLLGSLIEELLSIPLPSGTSGPIASTHLSVLVLDKHLPDLLKAGLVLGWLPKSQATESIQPVDHLRSVVIYLLSILPVMKVIAALSSVLSDPSMLPYVRKTCTFFLGRQVLRTHGVQGLLIGLFGEEEEFGEEAPLEKLEHISRLLRTVPRGVPETDYYRNIVFQLINILSSTESKVPSAHTRAAAFTLSRLVGLDVEQKPIISRRTVLSILHQPFLQTVRRTSEKSPTTQNNHRDLSTLEALSTIRTLLVNSDPSPTLISGLLTPIIPALYALSASLEEHKASDPALKATVSGLLNTWGRIIGTEEGVASIWLIIEGEGGHWKVDLAGEVARLDESGDEVTGLSLFTPESLRQAEEAGEFDADVNVLHLRPNPVHFVRYLKSIDRSDITGDIFVRLLETYRESKATLDSDPMRTLLYLQIVMQIQSQLATDDSAANILKKPDHILTFIKHALDAAVEAKSHLQPKTEGLGLSLGDLRIVEQEDIEIYERDSDDEPEGEAAGEAGDDDMTSTAVNLLLSVLEANHNLSIQTTPILDEIFDLLDRLAKAGPEHVKPLAREARMVLTARLASGSSRTAAKSKRTPAEQSTQETYQKALKLLQDPILPVRAHGLLLLRQLVSSHPGPKGKLEPPAIDHALVPGILSIFLQSLQDDDSYIFLNAVQGLSAMVDGFGRETLKGLVELYAQGLEGVASTMVTKHDVDQRTRIGEALAQVIKRAADTLPGYADILVPPLFKVVRTSHLPTTLRTSALSLLAQCADTNPLALLPYLTELANAMVDLLQTESVPAKPARPTGTADESVEQAAEGQKPPPSMDTLPTAANAKFPPLRRAALHFSSILIKACVDQMSEESSRVPFVLPGSLMRRLRHTVAYVGATDEDNVVRVMAKELMGIFEGIDQMVLGV